MQLTKEELVKFKAWRNEKRKFWAQILLWGIWGGSSLVIFSLLGSLIPEEAMSKWMNYGGISVWLFILTGTVFGIVSTIRSSENEKAQGRKGPEAKSYKSPEAKGHKSPEAKGQK